MAAVTRSRPWSSADLFSLAALWGSPGLSLCALARRFGRTPYAVYVAAGRHGLARGVPEGWESVAAAARRTGYTVATLRRVLSAASVRTSTAWGNPLAPRTGAPKRAVRPADVDRAVAAWLARETVEEAARRVGVVPVTLRRWLRLSGCQAPGAGLAWRVGEGEVAAALAWRAERPPLVQHAAARGCSAKVLARRMGVRGGWRGRWWTSGEVEALVAARRQPHAGQPSSS
jgi:transposase-like protein